MISVLLIFRSTGSRWNPVHSEHIYCTNRWTNNKTDRADNVGNCAPPDTGAENHCYCNVCDSPISILASNRKTKLIKTGGLHGAVEHGEHGAAASVLRVSYAKTICNAAIVQHFIE